MEPEEGGVGVTNRMEEEDDYPSRNRECCPPQLFTSVLLGLLACVLVTGGVFLAFHKWDHTWLLVSAVGIVLMAIGTALHCCSSQYDHRTHRCKGGCGLSRTKPDTINNGAPLLSEQLLPLSNARSVSQLSLNMVPGYFPPLVFPAGMPYGLEQHSAVVQNISKLVQHQQQLHLQSPNSEQSDSKSFILFPLPVDANPANIQNIVAAVCQLDTNVSSGDNDTSATVTVPPQTSTEVSVPQSPQLVDVPTTTSYRNVEVQTEWNIEHKPPTVANASTTCEDVPESGPVVTEIVGQTSVQLVEQLALSDAAIAVNCDTTMPIPNAQPEVNQSTDRAGNSVIEIAVENVLSTEATSVLSQDDYSANASGESTTNNFQDSLPPAEISPDSISEIIGEVGSNEVDLESLDRSSPPPSYYDVTQESGTVVTSLPSFGIGYGTL